jgi:thiol-disulfide isomerase/thioredoxin
MKMLAGLLLCGAVLFAQAGKITPQEQEELSSALAEAGSSPQEYLRALEKHLAKYPNSPRKEELERAAARAAIEANDDGRIIRYGERVLARQPNDLQILERVARSLLAGESKDTSERALRYAVHYEELVRGMQQERPRDAEWQNQTDRGIGRALCYQARATGNLGKPDAALALAQRAFEQYPNAESAREVSHWCEQLGRMEDAARAMADAFTVPDARSTDADRARDRGQMGDLYRKAKGSEAGLGDLVLQAYDRNLALVHGRELRMRANDPNASLTDPMEFTLSGPDGGKLQMATLKGKVLVFDFWATWCGPCRIQHPLYEQVKQRFRDNRDVVFLAVTTDADRNAVKPFLDQLKWPGEFWFEDGLSRVLKITSIPTTLIIGRNGQVFSRMNGFVPERFVEMLTARIREAVAVH